MIRPPEYSVHIDTDINDMAIKLYCIFTVVVAPLLVVIHWLRYHIIDSTQQQSSVKVMMDSGGSGSSNSMNAGSGGTGEEWMKDITKQVSNQEVSPPQQKDYPCKKSYSHLPHCNTALSKEERVQYIISQLNTKEKISLLGHDSPSIKHTDLYLPEYKWWNEGLHGMAWTDCCPPYKWKNVTVFPQVIGLSMSFNRTSWSEIGGIIGTEALQKVHDSTTKSQIHPGLTYFTPNINIFRDPRWGRGQETPGEDPVLTSHYAAVIIMSLQYGNGFLKQLYGKKYTKTNQSSMKPRISATCKHFAAYSLETDRFTFSADDISNKDWTDTYLPAFDSCIHAEKFLNDYFEIEESSVSSSRGALGAMCSYNSVDGTPSCANKDLLQKKLRNDWDYSGYVVSDCWAIANIYESHNYTSSLAEAAGVAISSGVDLDCGDTVQGHGYKAVQEGYMTIEHVDRALSNLFGVLVDVGYFDQDEHSAQTDDDASRVQYHNQVALEAALQSIVLLKNGDNESSPLPLSTTKHRKVTLVGPLAHDKDRGKGDILLGNYHGVPTNIITPKDGLEGLGLEVEYYQGCDVTDKSSKGNSSVQKEDVCQQMSDNNDAIVLVMGLSQDLESESLDRTTLQLPDIQHKTIQHISQCAKASNPNTPVILVLITGGAIDVSSYKANKDIDAILYTNYPGQAAGQALVEVLYGMYNPSGRLTTTIYQNSYMNEVALDDMQMRPHESSPGRTYRFYTGESVVYPFGHGLSYSKWDYSLEMMKDEAVVAVNVSNKAGPDGAHSVLLFHQGPNAGKKGNPIKALIDFDKVYVSSGDSQTIHFNIKRWIESEEKGTHTFMVGPSDESILQITVPM